MREKTLNYATEYNKFVAQWVFLGLLNKNLRKFSFSNLENMGFSR